MGKAQDELVAALNAALDASTCGVDDKLKCLGEARTHVTRAVAGGSLEKWREDRLKQGSFNKSEKKAPS